MIQNKHKLAFLLCLLLMATTAFGASEAEYKKLAKTWTLNADGSQEFRYNMELTLFTHTAMNGTTILSLPNRVICRRLTFSKSYSNPLPSKNTP